MQLLEHVYARLQDYTIWLYLDRARRHRGLPVENFRGTHRRLHLNYLPPYQPGLNPQERIWRRMRFEATTNRWFETLGEIWAAVQNITRSWSKGKIRRLCNVI